MSFGNVMSSIHDALQIELFKIGEAAVTPAGLLIFLIILLVAHFLSKLAGRGIRRFFADKDSRNQANGDILQRIVHYGIMMVGAIAALQTVGIDLSTLFAAGAVFAVGLGFAMQNISQNFVSGLILLIERTIKQGDVIEVDGMVVRVERIGIRATLVRTRNEEELIVPNSILVQSVVKNYTLSDSSFLIGTEVGVTYGSDMRRVREVLEQAANAVEWRDQELAPRILLSGFGDSSVNFRVLVFIDDPWTARRRVSSLNEKIWWALKAAEITIAFPQLDVHFDAPIGPPETPEPASSAAQKRFPSVRS